MKIVQPSVELVRITENPLELIELAGRICYQSQDRMAPGSADAFVRARMAEQHASIVEHASATFVVTIDRGVLAEWTRHRIASYSVESTRYCNYSKGKFNNEIKVIQPPLRDDEIADWLGAVAAAEYKYLKMLRNGSKPEIARSVLPLCLATQMMVTCNFREWLHFLHMRTSPRAHPQIAEVARKVGAILAKECPVVFGGNLVASARES